MQTWNHPPTVYIASETYAHTLRMHYAAHTCIWKQSLTMPRICVNNTFCNKMKLVPETEIQAPSGKEQHGVGDTRVSGSMDSECLMEYKLSLLRNVFSFYWKTLKWRMCYHLRMIVMGPGFLALPNFQPHLLHITM